MSSFSDTFSDYLIYGITSVRVATCYHKVSNAPKTFAADYGIPPFSQLNISTLQTGGTNGGAATSTYPMSGCGATMYNQNGSGYTGGRGYMGGGAGGSCAGSSSAAGGGTAGAAICFILS
jgi:hypothetical protein